MILPMFSTAQILPAVLAFSLVCSLTATTSAAPPSVNYLNPAGGQVGQKVDVSVDKTPGNAAGFGLDVSPRVESRDPG